MRHAGFFLGLLVALGSLSGCATSGLGKVKEGVMEMAGFAPKPAEKSEQQKQLQLKIFAGPNLNLDQRGRPLAVVVRLYQLRDTTAFAQASYDTLADPQQAMAALASELVDVKEFVIKPGEALTRNERLVEGAAHLGVVALYRKPFPGRWRLSFELARQTAGQVVLGAHACALTVSRGVLPDTPPTNMSSLGGVSCE